MRETKWCPGCEWQLPSEKFHKNKSRSDGLADSCGQCSSISRKKKYKDDPASRLESARKARKTPCGLNRLALKRYGITETDWWAMFQQQQGSCPICGEWLIVEGKRLPDIDHDHETGRVRGLLHNRCNLLLGYAQDDQSRLTRAATYLQNPTTSKLLAS